MATFKDFLKDPVGVTPRTKLGREGRLRPPKRTIYSEDLNESMLKGVWRMLDDEHEEDCEISYEDQEELDPEAGGEEDPEMDDMDAGAEDPEIVDEEPEDPDRAGVIRQVDDAHLIYKRQNEDSTYDELWIYNINDQLDDELVIRRAILAGTDIEPNKTRSEDGTQSYSLVTMGNAQYVHIKGLPN